MTNPAAPRIWRQIARLIARLVRRLERRRGRTRTTPRRDNARPRLRMGCGEPLGPRRAQ